MSTTNRLFEIFDIQGKIVLSVKLDTGSHDIWVGQLPNGNYLARLSALDKIWIEKVMIQH